MKRKNGFTLIELLAVIVILAIIALIATPTILGVVEKAKKGASKASALAYIDAVEKYMLLHDMDSTKYPYSLESGKTYYVIPDSEIEIATINKSILPVVHAEEAQTPVGDIYLEDFIEVKGEAPVDGYVVIGEKSIVASATFIVNNYEVTCENSDKCEVVGKYDSNIIKAKSVTISSEKSQMYIGDSLQLTATVLPEDTTNKKVKWTSSDETIATVDENGLVTAIKSGEVEITATTSNKKTATKNIKVKLIKLIDTNGNGTADIGETVTIGSENFYVISNDNTTVSVLAYYNLNAGGVYNSGWTAYTNPTYRQDENMKGYVSSGQPYNGTLAFANSNGWSYSNNDTIPTSYYSQYLTDALTNYDIYIKSLGANITSTRLITYNELVNLGCIRSSNSCSSSGKDWLYSSTYWTGSARSDHASNVWVVNSDGGFDNIGFDYAFYYGARPVLDISVSEL